MLVCAGVLFTYEVAFGSVHTALASTEDEAKSVQLVSEIQTSLARKKLQNIITGKLEKSLI